MSFGVRKFQSDQTGLVAIVTMSPRGRARDRKVPRVSLGIRSLGFQQGHIDELTGLERPQSEGFW